MTTGNPRKTAIRPVLVTGFEPFAGEIDNPSLEIARALDGKRIAGHRVVGAVLPTEFRRSLSILGALLRKHRPLLVIAIGQAGGRAQISLERVAINLIDARIADNSGEQPVDVPVIRDAPAAYFSTLPLKAMLQRLLASNIPAALSQSAGVYVCNQVMFGLLHQLQEHRPRARGGFVHVPFLPQQATRHYNAPSMALATMIEAIALSIETALTTPDDLHYAAGATH